MPIRRNSAVRSRNNLSKSIDPRLKVPYNDNADSGFSENESINENNRIYFILLRAHSGIPYIRNQKTIAERVDTVTVRDDMNFYKITSSINGEPNCGRYNYEEKRRDILTTIAKDELNQNKPTNVEARLSQITNNIQRILRQKEQGLFNKSQERSSISTKTFLNKTFKKYSDEFTIQLLYIDEDDLHSKKTDLLNYFSHYELYDSVIDYCGYESVDSDTEEKIDVFDLKGLIDYLYMNPKFNARNVILMDFSCSSLPTGRVDNELIRYLNEKNLHGGKYKLKSNINKKKTKKDKNTNNRKTKKRKTKT